MTHRARRRIASRAREPRLRFVPLKLLQEGQSTTRNYSCPTCRYENRIGHEHQPERHPER